MVECLLRCGFVGQSERLQVDEIATAHIDDERYLVFLSKRRKLGFRHRIGKALDAIVTGMHAHQ